ncbi:MAG: TerC/Alx family metal homeostasis membrane protein [Candidatus Acidiferrales bacterium]
MPGTPVWLWLIFAILVLLLLAVDLLAFHRQPHKIGIREALIESAGWISVALLFNWGVYYWRGPHAAIHFFTSYLIEKSLSVDNIFLFYLILRAFRVPEEFHHKVLYYGVLGAIVMRGIFVAAGIEMLNLFHPFLYIFGALLLGTGARMLRPRRKEPHPEKNWLVRALGRIFPVVEDDAGGQFWIRRDGRRFITSMLLALVAVEAMDILFALDSIPAVLAITRDAFIVYSSNVFAILGLRALYFALAGLLPRLRFLDQGLAGILIFVGIKMVAAGRVEISDAISLGIVAGILLLTAAASLLWPKAGAAIED